jgi:hypothetical protein
VCQKSQKPRSPYPGISQREKAARDKIKKHLKYYNLLQGDIGFLPLVASTLGRLDALDSTCFEVQGVSGSKPSTPISL